MSAYADGYRAGIEAAAKVAEEEAGFLVGWTKETPEQTARRVVRYIRALPVPAVDEQPEVERLRAALKPFEERARRKLQNDKLNPARRAWYDQMPGTFPIDLTVTAQDARNAIAALGDEP